MILLLLGMAFAAAAQEEATVLTLTFDRMHCDDCKVELEAGLKKAPGVKSVAVAEGTATVTLEEKAAIPALNRLPKDLVLKSTGIRIRGTVVFSGDKGSLIAKGSGATLALANPEKPGSDPLGALRKAMGGKNRFQLTGLLVGGKSLVLSGFQASDWKD